MKAVLLCLSEFKEKVKDEIDTVYFGGGTPSVFSGERIEKVIECIRENYTVTSDAEITVECNPSSVDENLVQRLKKCGVNRISMGMQSAVENERHSLGRISGKDDVKRALKLFKAAGIDNISLDLMLGIPYQTKESLKESLDFLLESKVRHISAYILKIEQNTPFSLNPPPLPDEDEVCELYLYACEYLEKNGFEHYEISNFALHGFESRHNLKYWNCEEYLGIGPSAHSFLNKERFFFERDFEAFLTKRETIFDGYGADEEEYIMLALRLSKGLTKEGYYKRFKKDIPEKVKEQSRKLSRTGLVKINADGDIKLTDEGFLLSNSIIVQLLS